MINLTPHFSPLGSKGAIDYKSFVFGGGEPHIKIAANFNVAEQLILTSRINSFNDLGLICITVDALRRMGVKEIKLFIPYFPAARQDRVMVLGEPLSVKVYADIINAMNLECVTVFDPHSEVTPALLNNCVVVSNHQFIKKVIEKIGADVKLVSPDGGALKKIYKVSEFLSGAAVVECSKSRDVKTGKLSGFRVYADDLNNEDCLIVDDICDGGGTFIGLAQELKNKNAGKLYLAISHGIFSKGFDELGKYFDQIFTTDSIKEIDHTGVTQIKLEELGGTR
jgi:ribose-phosphate pyrophosphokinase